MTYNELKKTLATSTEINFMLPDYTLIPQHFHVTEMGTITKHYIDCGNTIRKENKVSFQIWFAEDYQHRLTPSKFLKILQASEPLITDPNAEVEVEYQTSQTIGKWGLSFDKEQFLLMDLHTTCLANDHCGIPEKKMKISLKELGKPNTCCEPHASCC